MKNDFIKEENFILLRYDLQFFAEEGPGGEKTEEPTSKRLDDARDKGQVAKSKEIGSAFSLLAAFILLQLILPGVGHTFQAVFPSIYNRLPELTTLHNGEVPKAAVSAIMRTAFIDMLLICAPFFAVTFLVALICGLAQVGWKFTSEPLKPKFSKMNPISGLKRIISKESIFGLVLATLKIALISVVVYNYLMGREESIFLLYDIPLNRAIELLGDMVVGLGIRIAVTYMIIALADFIYQKRKFHEDMKMTKQEIKDEIKNDEGDPQIKAQQRQRMRQAAQRRMMQDIPKADVVITNPTHFAVAVQYDQSKYPAPVIVAKGADHLAKKIKEIAKKNKIEIVENKPLARTLYANVEVGEMIPPEMYKAVAEVLAFVYHAQGKT